MNGNKGNGRIHKFEDLTYSRGRKGKRVCWTKSTKQKVPRRRGTVKTVSKNIKEIKENTAFESRMVIGVLQKSKHQLTRGKGGNQ